MTTTAIARAPAKINLHLAVGAPGDGGFHELATLYQAVDLVDQVTAKADDSGEITVTVFDGRGAEVPGVPLDERNLAVRAALLLREHAARPDLGVALSVAKRIPVAAGLAGGSADAAASLIACRSAWGIDVSSDTLVDLASQLGSDVPFALIGGTAVGSGRGDKVTALPPGPTLVWLAAWGPAGMATPDVYAELDELREGTAVPRPTVPAELLRGLAGDREAMVAALLGHGRNDLMTPALSLRADLAAVLEAGVVAGAELALVAGSGPTALFLAADREDATRLGAALAAHLHVVATRVLTGPVAGAQLVP